MSQPLDLRGRAIIADAGATRTLFGIKRGMHGVAKQATAMSTVVTNAGKSATLAGKRMQKMTGGVSGTGLVGFGAAAGGAAFLRNEYNYQAAMNRTQAILNITNEKAFKPHRDLVIELAKRYPTTSAQIAQGASELAMAGMSLKEVNNALEATVQGSMASGESIKIVGMGVTDVVMGLGKALTKGNFLHINNVLAAGATSYAQNYRQFLDGLAKTAPLARMQGMAVERLVGILGILADAGFKGAKGGTALRTSMINAAAPSKKAQDLLARYNVDLTKFQKRVDNFQLTGAKGARSLSEYIAQELNIDSERANLSSVLKPILSDPKALKNIPSLKQRLAAAIRNSLGVDDPENARLIGKSVERFVQAGFQQMNFEGFLRHLAKEGLDNNTVLMKELFGKRFVAQMAGVIASMRSGAFDKKLGDIFLPRIEGAVKRFAQILMKGLPGALKRLAGAFDGLMRALASSGAIDEVVKGLNWLRDAINGLSKTDKTILKWATLAGLGFAALAPIGFVIMGVVGGITSLATGIGLLVGAGATLARFTGILKGFSAAAKAAGAAAAAIGLGAAGAGAGAAATGAGAAGAGALALSRKRALPGAGKVASGAAAGKVGGRLLGRLIPGLGWALAAYGIYEAVQAYRKTGSLKDAGKAFIGLPTGDGKATPGAGAGRTTAQKGGPSVEEMQRTASRIKSIAGGIDLTAEGRRVAETFAAGIRSGAASVEAAAQDLGRRARAASKVQLNTGPSMQGLMP